MAWSDETAVQPGAVAPSVAFTTVVGVLALLALFVMVTSTRARASGPDSEASALERLGGRAEQLAAGAGEEPVLRQVEVVAESDARVFRFVDPEARREIDVRVWWPDSPVERWEVSAAEYARTAYQAAPALDLRALRTGPQAARGRLAEADGQCAVMSQTLFGEGARLSWSLSCRRPDGVIMATVDGSTGALHLPSASPAQPASDGGRFTFHEDGDSSPRPAAAGGGQGEGSL